MNYTDDQLKQLLAKMLPETVNLELIPTPTLEYKNGRIVLDTELLHLCSLVEAGLTNANAVKYRLKLAGNSSLRNSAYVTVEAAMCHATWQQRVTALATVKEVSL